MSHWLPHGKWKQPPKACQPLRNDVRWCQPQDPGALPDRVFCSLARSLKTQLGRWGARQHCHAQCYSQDRSTVFWGSSHLRPGYSHTFLLLVQEAGPFASCLSSPAVILHMKFHGIVHKFCICLGSSWQLWTLSSTLAFWSRGHLSPQDPQERFHV